MPRGPRAHDAPRRHGTIVSSRRSDNRAHLEADHPTANPWARAMDIYLEEEADMLRDVILWLAGVPIVVIVLLHLFGFLG